MISFIISLCMLISPLWPLGENPSLGDPYLIVNKQSNQLGYIENGAVQKIYDVSTGKEETLTPEGEFSITVKAANPYYRKKNIEGGDPANPLGTRWIGFDALETDGRTYGVHGTNDETSIGKYITAGCIRLHNREVEELFSEVPVGAKIWILSSEKTFEELGQEKGILKKVNKP
ncbi:L,D-transpeptidase family protein [Bacillus lacus]|uniref:L,D-transpeptidase family protein n=1 Tax=Metabacillus lacus TaxID=1983721 RepID=A0A7X2J0Q3_9BACI|nr:L,D-transpeptidase [Metabacillus lacus]MRX73134.1 L,D-transpeptidase family protein [Metabacillus lacus]